MKKKTKFIEPHHCETAIEPATPLYDKIPAVVRELMDLQANKN